MCNGGNPLDSVGDFFEDTVDFAGDVLGDVVDFAGDVIETVGDVAEGILKDPLPVIQTIALTAALGPGGLALATTTAGAAAIAGAAMAAMNGGDIKEIAIAAGTSYLGSEIGRVAGAQAGANAAIQGMDKVTQETIKQVVTSASGSAAVTALKGGSLEDVLKAGTTAAVGSYVNSTLVREYGFNPKALDTQLITNSTAAATRAVLNGKSITEAVTNTAAVSALALTISGSVDQLKSSDAAYKKVYDDFNKLKESATSWAEKNLVPAGTLLNSRADFLTKQAEEYNQLKTSYDEKYAQWEKFKAQNNTGEANKLAKELNALAERSKQVGQSVETGLKDYLDARAAYDEKNGLYEVNYLNKLNALGQQAQTIAETQQRLSSTLGENIAKYEQEVALAERMLGEKIKIKAMETVKYDYYMDKNVPALKELGYSDAEAKQIAEDFYETEVSYEASKLQQNVGKFVKDYANLSRLNPVASDFVDELISEGSTAQDALKKAKDAADVVSYENAVARGDKEWTDSEGRKNILITGVGSSADVPAPKVDEAVTKIGGLFGFGGGDPNALYRALFGGGGTGGGKYGLFGYGTAEQKQQAVQFVDEVINSPTSTPVEKAEAEKLKEKIKTEEQMSLKKTADRKAAEKEVALAGQQATAAKDNLDKLIERAVSLEGTPDYNEARRLAAEAVKVYDQARANLKEVENRFVEVIKDNPVELKGYQDVKASEPVYSKTTYDAKIAEIDQGNWQKIYDAGVSRERAMIEAKAEAERLALIKAEQDRQAAIVAEQQRQADMAAEAERQRQANMAAEAERQRQAEIVAKAEAERQAAITAEKERLRLQAEANARAEAERQEAERQAAEKIANEQRLAREAAAAAEQKRLADLAEAERQRQMAEENARIEAQRKAEFDAARAEENRFMEAKLAEEAAKNKAEQEARAREEIARAGTGTVGGGTGETTGGTGGGSGTPGGGGTTDTGTGTGGTGTGGTGAGTGGTGTGSGTGGTGTGGGGTGGTGSGGGTGLPRIPLPRTPAYLAFLGLLNKAREQGAGYQFTLPDLLASRQALQKSPTGEFVTPVEYTYRSTGEPYVPGQFTPPAPPTTQAAEGGLMLDFDPTNSVKLYQAGGDVDAGQIYRLAQASGLGTDNDTLNAIMRYMSQGMSPQEAADYVQRLQSKSRSTKRDEQMRSQGLMGLAKGGNLPPRYLNGGTDGMADQIPAKIGANQPAALSHGEFVIPADVVSHLGNGNSEAGANVLYDMMARIRKARTGTTKQGKQINPKKFMPK